MQTITVYAPGHYDIADSYGLIACQLARHLTGLGVRVNALGMGKTVMDSQPPDIRAITTQPIKPTLGGIMLGYPTGYGGHTNPLAHMGPRIGITMFESSRIPASWVQPLNGMDAVIVPSTFCADVFKACGVTSPIHVVPLGISEVYQHAPRPTDRPLTFLTFLDRGLRKGGLQAVHAFVRAFGDDMDYRLICKTRKAKVALTMKNPNIEVVQQDMTEEELYELYLRADVLINPHKGEGWGMIPREFAATGGVAMTTHWSGTADDIDLWGVPLPYTLVNADWAGVKSLQGQDLGEWAEPDIDGIARLLHDVAANRTRYLWYAALAGAYARHMYSWRDFAAQVLEVWTDVANAKLCQDGRVASGKHFRAAENQVGSGLHG